MKSIRYFLAISFIIACSIKGYACGPYSVQDPMHIRMFRSCTPELSMQWQEGCRFQDYEKAENCKLWQRITSSAIPTKDIERVVYAFKIRDLKNLQEAKYADNKFVKWLTKPRNAEDLEYMLVAKEIEQLREYMNDPWYYPYDGDDEHKRLEELLRVCSSYTGSRHADRYALQLARLYFANKDYQKCIDMWESKVAGMPKNIITDMLASYAGGAYLRKGDRDKAIQLFTRSQDIGSLISMKAWDGAEKHSAYKDKRIKELEYIFNRFPNSPLLSIKLQQYVRDREDTAYYMQAMAEHDNCDNELFGDEFVDVSAVKEEKAFYDELKRFALNAAMSNRCKQKGMWYYALAYLYHIDGNNGVASNYLSMAESSQASDLIKDSIRSLRMLMRGAYADNSAAYRNELLNDMKWLDTKMQEDIKQDYSGDWKYDNKMNWSFYFWQDVARKVLLGEVCKRLDKAGNTTMALQLANYASNRIHQLSPLFQTFYSVVDGDNNVEYISTVMPFDEYRNAFPDTNDFDYSNQFFGWINGVSADKAARYASTIAQPKTEFDRFINSRCYADTDYIYDIVGTLYLREMNYDKAAEWLGKVSKGYQARTNVQKGGYFNLDPFKYQTDKKCMISDSTDYKLRFAQEMSRLEKQITSNTDANKKAQAKIRYATGLRNSFGRCWYLTDYGFDMVFEPGEDWEHSKVYRSVDRHGFKDNPYAKKAYDRVDSLLAEALSEFTDPELAAQAQLEMKNFRTVMSLYPDTKAAEYVRGHCDKYYDYAIQKL